MCLKRPHEECLDALLDSSQLGMLLCASRNSGHALTSGVRRSHLAPECSGSGACLWMGAVGGLQLLRVPMLHAALHMLMHIPAMSVSLSRTGARERCVYVHVCRGTATTSWQRCGSVFRFFSYFFNERTRGRSALWGAPVSCGSATVIFSTNGTRRQGGVLWRHTCSCGSCRCQLSSP